MAGHKPDDKDVLNDMVRGIDSLIYENFLKNIEGILSGGNVHNSERFIRCFIMLCL